MSSKRRPAAHQNGHLARLQEETRVARARADLARARAEARAMEESVGLFGTPGWADLYDPYAMRRDDFGTPWLPYGAGALHARQGGKHRPFVWTDFDLDLNRSLARHLVTGNDLAKGYVKAIRNFVVKRGYEWEARPAAGLAKDPEAVRLAERVQRVIDRDSDLNKLPQRERSACLRSLRDGDAIVRHFDQGDGTTLLRFVEPEQCRTPPGAPENSALGVEYLPGDIETPLAYYVTYDGAEYEAVPAEDVSHFKRNVDECVVRGLGEFVSSGDTFDGVRKMLRNMVVAGGVQAAIAWIEQFADATASQVSAHVTGVRDLNRPQYQGPITGRDVNARQYQPGAIPLVGKGKEYVPPPVPVGASAHTQIVQAALRSVATAWNMPEYMISSDASNSNYACHDSATELLTKRGWLTWDQVRYGDVVGTMNPDTKAFEWQSLQAIHVYDYDGPMVRLHGSHSLDVMVTPNHRMYRTTIQHRRVDGKMTRDGVKPFEFCRADELRPGDVLPFTCRPKVGVPVETFELPGTRHSRPYLDDASHPQPRTLAMSGFLRYLGWWVSEGWTVTKGKSYPVGVCQSAKQLEECEEIRGAVATLSDAGINVREHLARNGMRSWRTDDKSLWTWLRANCGTGSWTKRLPEFVNDLPASQQSQLLQSLVMGDGSHTPSGMAYFTVSRRLADQVQSLAIQCGFVASIGKPMANGVIPISIKKPNRLRKVSAQHIDQVPYRGTVWCVTVPNGLAVTRRNGKAIVTGNSVLVAGSPFVNGIECEQDDYGLFFLRWRWIAVRNAWRAGLLGPYTFEQIQEAIDIHYTAPLVAISKESEQAEIDHKDIAAGVLSLPTRAARRGLDWEQEQANNAKYPPTRVAGKATDLDAHGNPVATGRAADGAGAGAGGGPSATTVPPPSAPPVPADPRAEPAGHPGLRETKDASGHEHDDKGQFTSGPGGSAGSHADKKAAHETAKAEHKARGEARQKAVASLEARKAAVGDLPDVRAGADDETASREAQHALSLAHAGTPHETVKAAAGVVASQATGFQARAQEALAALQTHGGNDAAPKASAALAKHAPKVQKHAARLEAALAQAEAHRGPFEEASAALAEAEAAEPQEPPEGAPEADVAAYERAHDKWEANADKLAAKKDRLEERLASAIDKASESAADLADATGAAEEAFADALDEDAQAAEESIDAELDRHAAEADADAEPDEPEPEDDGGEDEHP